MSAKPTVDARFCCRDVCVWLSFFTSVRGCPVHESTLDERTYAALHLCNCRSYIILMRTVKRIFDARYFVVISRNLAIIVTAVNSTTLFEET